jgi:serine/threonine protein kinase
MSDFRNEVEILGKLRHPTIVAMMAYCCDAPDLLLMMEYMEVRSLLNFCRVLWSEGSNMA